MSLIIITEKGKTLLPLWPTKLFLYTSSMGLLKPADKKVRLYNTMGAKKKKKTISR